MKYWKITETKWYQRVQFNLLQRFSKLILRIGLTGVHSLLKIVNIGHSVKVTSSKYLLTKDNFQQSEIHVIRSRACYLRSTMSLPLAGDLWFYPGHDLQGYSVKFTDESQIIKEICLTSNWCMIKGIKLSISKAPAPLLVPGLVYFDPRGNDSSND